MLRAGILLALVTALALIFLLIRAVDHRSLSDENITYLLIWNGCVAGALLIAMIAMTLRLKKRLADKQFGSKLLIKLAAIFALVGLLPGVLIYCVSYQFVSRSIETWFDVRVEGALEAGLNLGRQTLENLSSDLSSKVKASAATLDLESNNALAVSLDRLREQLRVDDAQVWSQTGQLLASSGESRFQLAPEKPTSAQMRALKSQRSVSSFDGLDGTQSAARLKVLVPLSAAGLGLQSDMRYLLVSEKLPAALVTNALAVQSAYSEYQERALARAGLQKMYIGTLTLSLFLAVLGAFILAVILGNQLVRPLLVLALGVERVSQGDLSPKLELHEDDELAGLTRSFASMTHQLAQARILEQKTERVKAWNEIAQRVAHEIKNPLTPIQLSAERMEMKLSHKLEGTDLALLQKSVKTIVDQVEAMKRLVNEFRDYARLPSANLQPLALQEVIEDTLHLYDNEVQAGQVHVANLVSMHSKADTHRIQGDAEQLRQVIHNLLQNALDATQTAMVDPQHIHIVIELSIDSTQGLFLCSIQDNGGGFAPHVLANAFEPYNTTKPKGTGLGLAVVRKIIQEHRGTITLSNVGTDALKGARVQLSFPLMQTELKKDMGI